jgi:UDP-glucose 4-epimerase
VYGLTQDLTYLSESNPLKPNNVYGLSKKFAEEIINRYSEYYGIKGLIFRISNVYGEGCRPYYNSAIATFIDLIQKGEKIIINGSGKQSRDFIYVSDVVKAFSKSLNYHFKSTEILNICTGKAVNINEIICTLEEVSGITPKVEYKKIDEQVNYLIGNPSKAKKVFKYKAEIGLEEGLKRTVTLGGKSYGE